METIGDDITLEGQAVGACCYIPRTRHSSRCLRKDIYKGCNKGQKHVVTGLHQKDFRERKVVTPTISLSARPHTRASKEISINSGKGMRASSSTCDCSEENDNKTTVRSPENHNARS
jgi:hypothetical protein